MKARFFSRTMTIVTILLVMIAGSASAQQKTDLYKEIAHMDSVLFNAFNAHDLETIKKVFDKGIEFYHDLGGLTNYDENMEAFKKTFEKNNGLKRELVPGSLEVYPINNYGAIQIGSHRFCHIENGKPDCGIFKFVHVWQKKDGEWKLTRIVSYGH